MALDRKCIVCPDKHHYKYCSNCSGYNSKETWRFLYCSQNCKEIYSIATDFVNGKLTGLEAKHKLEKFKELGIDPFGHRFDRDSFANEIKEKYKDVEHDEFENLDVKVTIAGRIMFIRKMGKASFFTIKDKTGNIQIYISVNDIGEEQYERLNEKLTFMKEESKQWCINNLIVKRKIASYDL